MIDDPLEGLIVDEAIRMDRARELLAGILKTFIEISAQSGDLSLLPKAYELPPQEQILVLLCGRLAQKYLEKLPKGKDEKMSQVEILTALPALPHGTVKGYLKKLRDENFIMNADKKNFVSPGHLSKIEKRLRIFQKKI